MRPISIDFVEKDSLTAELDVRKLMESVIQLEVEVEVLVVILQCLTSLHLTKEVELLLAAN